MTVFFINCIICLTQTLVTEFLWRQSKQLRSLKNVKAKASHKVSDAFKSLLLLLLLTNSAHFAQCHDRVLIGANNNTYGQGRRALGPRFRRTALRPAESREHESSLVETWLSMHFLAHNFAASSCPPRHRSRSWPTTQSSQLSQPVGFVPGVFFSVAETSPKGWPSPAVPAHRRPPPVQWTQSPARGLLVDRPLFQQWLLPLSTKRCQGLQAQPNSYNHMPYGRTEANMWSVATGRLKERRAQEEGG